METQRYSLTESPVVSEKFATGETVTISIWDLSDGSVVPLTSSSCSEIGTTGIFKFALSNITTYPSATKEYVYEMTNSSDLISNKFILQDLDDLANGANQTTITVNDATPNPIASVQVQVFNSAQTVLLDVKTTDANGQVVFALDDGSYKVVLAKPQYTFTVPEDLTVSGVTTDTYAGAPIVITPGAGAGECEVSIFAASQRPTVPLSTIVATATIVELPLELNGVYYPNQKIAGTYDSVNFRVFWILPQGATVAFKADLLGIQSENAIPATASADYKDL